jgi:hypothetical protein
MHRGKERAMATIETFQKLLDEGWRRGVGNTGENSPAASMRWINNHVENKYVKQAILDSFLFNGWITGRIMPRRK